MCGGHVPNAKFHELIVDCTNQLRHAFARAVLCGLRKLNGKLPESDGV
jgi:hypothetical protein